MGCRSAWVVGERLRPGLVARLLRVARPAARAGSVPDGRIAYLGDHEANETLLSMFDNRSSGARSRPMLLSGVAQGLARHDAPRTLCACRALSVLPVPLVSRMG